MFSVDPATGKASPTVAIGPHIDGIGMDEKRKRIVTSSDAGFLSVIQQKGPDQFELLGTVTTRVEARMMFMDERNGNLYLVTADSTTSKPDAAGNARQVYHPNSFVVLTYKPI
jgi:hypothetical protein